MGTKILIIDDDPGLLVLLQHGLEREGFCVVTAESGKAGFFRAYDEHPDLIILDIMMPEVNGWTTYRQLRRITRAPVIILTAMATREDIDKGLTLGVDAFLTKPCGFDELRARIDEVLGEHARQADDQHVLFDDGYLCIDLMRGVSVRGGHRVQLTPTESRLLLYLARRKGEAVPREELLVNVWGPEYAEELSYLDLFIRHLCQKIEQDPQHPCYLRARENEGYCFPQLAGVVSPR